VAYNAVNLKMHRKASQPSNRLTAASCPWRVAFAALLAMFVPVVISKKPLNTAKTISLLIPRVTETAK